MVSNIKATVRTDFVGNDITVGTKVIFMQLGYRNFLTGVVVKMADKKCTIMGDNNRKAVQFYHQVIGVNHG